MRKRAAYLPSLKGLFSASIGALAIIGVMLASGPTTTYASSDIDLVAIDMNTSGNNTVTCQSMPNPGYGIHCAPGTLGTLQTCAEVDPGGSVVVDVVVNSIPGVVAPSGAGPDLQGYDIALIFNPAVATVTMAQAGPGGPPGNLGMQYAGTPQGPHSSTTDPPPGIVSGSFHMGEIDFGVTGEFGAGILMRLTLQGVSPGTSSLVLKGGYGEVPNPQIYDNSGYQTEYTIGHNKTSTLAVHPSTCPAEAVGGTAALTVSSAESSLPWTTGGAAGAALISAALGAVWYLRRRVSTRQ